MPRSVRKKSCLRRCERRSHPTFPRRAPWTLRRCMSSGTSRPPEAAERAHPAWAAQPPRTPESRGAAKRPYAAGTRRATKPAPPGERIRAPPKRAAAAADSPRQVTGEARSPDEGTRAAPSLPSAVGEARGPNQGIRVILNPRSQARGGVGNPGRVAGEAGSPSRRMRGVFMLQKQEIGGAGSPSRWFEPARGPARGVRSVRTPSPPEVEGSGSPRPSRPRAAAARTLRKALRCSSPNPQELRAARKRDHAGPARCQVLAAPSPAAPRATVDRSRTRPRRALGVRSEHRRRGRPHRQASAALPPPPGRRLRVTRRRRGPPRSLRPTPRRRRRRRSRR